MIGVNKVILIGNLGKNPDVVAFPQDRNDEASNLVKKASFPLATTEYRRNRDGERIEQTEWHNVVCWRTLAEIAEKILRKGTQIFDQLCRCIQFLQFAAVDQGHPLAECLCLFDVCGAGTYYIY